MTRAVVIVALMGLSGCDRCGSEKAGSTDASPTSTSTSTPTSTPTSTSTSSASPSLHCPAQMSLVTSFCIDTYEAHVVLFDSSGKEHPHSPYAVVSAPNVRAKSSPNVVPQAFVSQVAAKRACANASKRLCRRDEFERACRGPDDSVLYPYGGVDRVKGKCNEGKGSSIPRLFGTDVSKWTYEDFNDPRLNQWIGGLAKTGAYAGCVSPYGVYDLVGNLHEWGDDEADANQHGRFRGGFYGDAEVNGHGCLYVTKAHELTYHDYSTGFRCCADASE